MQDITDDSSSSSDSLFYNSESEVPHRLPYEVIVFILHDYYLNYISRNPNRLNRSPQEQREIKETVLSFRRRGEYEDPFKQWAKDTRTAAVVGKIFLVSIKHTSMFFTRGLLQSGMKPIQHR